METIVISGGATKGFGMLGILQQLYEKGLLLKLNNFIGSSVGGVIAFFLSCNETPMSIFLRCASKLPINMKTVHEAVVSTVEEFLTEKFNDKNITFIELYKKQNKFLVIPTYDISTQVEYYYSYLDSPEYKVIDAIEDTVRLPVFPIGSKLDGCFCSTFPIRYCKLHGLKNIIGIYVLGKYTTISSVKNIIDDLLILVSQLLNKNTILERELATPNDMIIELKTEVSALSFTISEQESVNLFIDGYTQSI